MPGLTLAPPRLHRVTTWHDADEDRVALSGATADGEVHAIWLTQRLLARALPHLFAWLDAALPTPRAAARPAAERATQAFFQEAATAVRRPLAPVSPPPASEAWLVRGIGVTSAATEVVLTFSSGPGGAGQVLLLPLGSVALRQWLGILHGQWRKAGWPPSVWPDWMASEAQAMTSGNAPVH